MNNNRLQKKIFLMFLAISFITYIKSHKVMNS